MPKTTLLNQTTQVDLLRDVLDRGDVWGTGKRSGNGDGKIEIERSIKRGTGMVWERQERCITLVSSIYK